MDRIIEYMPIDGLTPAPLNPKGHRLDMLQASMQRFSFTEPALIDDRTGRLVAGHGRVETLAAAQAAGLPAPEGVRVEDGRWLVPVVRGWASKDDAEASAYLVASNRLTEVGGWNDEGLTELLQGLAQVDGGLLGVGYDPVDIESLLASIDTVHVSEHERSDSGPIEARYVVLVECETEHQQRDLLERFMEEGLDVKALLT